MRDVSERISRYWQGKETVGKHGGFFRKHGANSICSQPDMSRPLSYNPPFSSSLPWLPRAFKLFSIVYTKHHKASVQTAWQLQRRNRTAQNSRTLHVNRGALSDSDAAGE